MKKLTLFRSIAIGMAVMMTALAICLIGNLLCIFSMISVAACGWIHSVLVAAVLVLLALFLKRLHQGGASEELDEVAFASGAMRLMHVSSGLILLLVLWAATFAGAIFLRG
ncbi:MAG: hypothetical protein J6D31_04330 [Clostridia bacterium]|nr:hypothetical protein [Clostridia bacterium]